jgi:hypothetical protein
MQREGREGYIIDLRLQKEYDNGIKSVERKVISGDSY